MKKLSEQLKTNRFLYVATRIIVGVIFIYAAIPKILNPADFIIQIENYRLLPDSFSYYTGLFLPWLELYCGLFILAGIWTKTNSMLLFVTVVVFIAAMLSALVRGLDIECGCFVASSATSPVSLLRIFEDILLLALIGIIRINTHPVWELEIYLKAKRKR